MSRDRPLMSCQTSLLFYTSYREVIYMKTIKHARLSEAQWRTIIADWQFGDIHRRQYCNQHNLVHHQFL